MRSPSPLSVSRLKLRQLQLLVQLRETASLVHAAGALNMSQSAASRLLTALEGELGVDLFTRHARGVVPTAYGDIVTRRAASALAEISRAGLEVRDLMRGKRLPLSIGGLLSLSSTFLPAAALELARRMPDLLVRVETERSRTLVDGLLSARFDIVVARVRDATLEPDLVFEPLVSEPIGVFVRPGHPLARKKKITLEMAVQQPWVMPPPQTDLRARLDALCLQQGLSPIAGLIETLSVPVIFSTVRMSDALVALPGEFARPFCESGVLQALGLDLGFRTDNVGIITRRHHELPPHLVEALGVLRDVSRTVYAA